ncbi:methyltransferase domain-containing protein [Gorillibacterium sp. sgz5001074]|uniref:class I SAM-dependent methyltransferase n=1 Tax=Gorillibacterium sp. sgz5001074 TaxID=3446695 RepID=UPI003F66EE75
MGNKEYYEQHGFAMTCRSYPEYVRMFACDPSLREGARVLDVAGGASSFGAGARQKGLHAVAADPLYGLSAEEMEAHGLRELEEAAGKLAGLTHKFDWTYYGSLEEHTRRRRESLNLFLQDYMAMQGTGAYVRAGLPELPFESGAFDYVFCSHFLFLYAESLPYEFHLSALLEMARVCKPGGELRIYPLLDLKQRPYERLDDLMAELRYSGLEPDLIESGLPFIPGSVRLLRVVNPGRKSLINP